MEDTKTTKFITLGDVSQFETNGVLNFSVPGVLGTLQSEAVHVEYTDTTNYIWSAKMTNQPGYLSFIVTPGAKVGFVQLQGQFFSICPINSTLSLLRELDLTKIPQEDCALFFSNTEPPPSEMNWCEPANTNCFAEIDLLILISTPDVQEWFGMQADPFVTIAAIIQGVESINLAFANSGIPNKHIRWRMETFEFGGYNIPLNALSDIAELAADASGLREQRQADVVMMLTARDYPGIAGVARALDFCPYPTPSSNCAYAIVEIQSIADPRWTFAHEFAHLLGARHNRSSNCSNSGTCGNDDVDVCAHAWLFDDAAGNEQRTILARMFDNEGAVRIPHFSNPDIEFNGGATGTEINNNARIIRNAACTTDDYNQADWTVGMEGPNQWCPPSITLDAISIPPTPGWGNYVGLPPYQYEWQLSCGPVGPWAFISNQSSITISNPYCQPTFWVQLKVTSSDALTRTVTQKIYPCDLYARGGEVSTSSSTEASIQSIATLSPNPANDAFSITFSDGGVSAATVHIANSAGNLVKNFSALSNLGLTVSTTDWPAGTYFVTIATDVTTETHKLFINKH
ncbi:MAG: T9SS type A sorting domain-containing protein [Saprospiraceae bacterium]